MALLWGAGALTCPLNFGVSSGKAIGAQNGAIILEKFTDEYTGLKAKHLNNK